MMARGVTNIFQIVVFAAGAHTSLRSSRAGVTALVGTKKDILELHHARIGKQQGRVVSRHQRARWHDGMSV